MSDEIHPEPEPDKMNLLPDGFVFLGLGPLKKKHFSTSCEDLAVWLRAEKAWKLISSQGAANCYYAARENSEAHLFNL